MKTLLKRAFAATAFLAPISAAHSQTIQYDGILSGADGYANSEIVTWYNSHDATTYGTFATKKYNTFIRYGVGTIAGDNSGTQYFFLFAEAPLEAKNMVWGSGMTALEISQYGKQLDFSGATGSEEIAILDSKGAELLAADIGSQVSGGGGKKDKKGTSSSTAFGLISFKDSVDYLIGNGISTTTSSAAHNVTMSVEMQFALNPEQNAAVIAAARNGLNFHLSPDRGLIPALVPEPTTPLLFGLLGVMGILRRKR